MPFLSLSLWNIIYFQLLKSNNPVYNNTIMEPIVLVDKTIKPTDEIVFSIIGEKSILWQEIMNYLYGHHTDITEEWNFYNDGKAWLFRTLKKKKTIFWIGVIKDTFRISFFLANKAEAFIEQSDLSDKLKNDFRNTKGLKTVRSISITVSDREDVINVIRLIDLKISLR